MNSSIEIKNYTKNLWGRRIETVYQVRRDYGREFLKIAREVKLDIEKEIVEFEDLQNALKRMKAGNIRGMVQVLKVA